MMVMMMMVMMMTMLLVLMRMIMMMTVLFLLMMMMMLMLMCFPFFMRAICVSFACHLRVGLVSRSHWRSGPKRPLRGREQSFSNGAGEVQILRNKE